MTFDIGFTGTRKGMTDHQYEAVHRLLSKGGVGFANHGDCLGADAQFHHICYELGIAVVIHPSEDTKQRAFCKGAALVETPLPYLKRNRNIVLRSALLVAAPAEAHEPKSKRGQGTWYTIGFAKQSGCDTLIIPPEPPR